MFKKLKAWQWIVVCGSLTLATKLPAGVLFDNGVSSGHQPRTANVLEQRLYDDFELPVSSEVTGFRWQQHDHNGMTYQSSRVTIYDGLPEVSPLLFSEDLVADRAPNATGTIFDSFNGFDYSIDGLSVSLPAGTYFVAPTHADTGGLGIGLKDNDEKVLCTFG